MKSRTKKNNKMKKNKKAGGGFTTGPALSTQAYYVPQYVSMNDCYDITRPGFLVANPNPELAQTPMAGGFKRMNNCKALAPIGSIQSNPRPNLAQSAGGKRPRRKTGRRTGGCGCGLKWGGARKTRKYGRKTGGRYMVEATNSIGGTGPVMVPAYTSIPCEGHRAMPINPANPSAFVDNGNPDINLHGIRPAFIQTGGSHPLAYEAPRAGFTFYPNIAQGEPLKPGMVPYEIVAPQATPCSTNCNRAIVAINK